MDLDTTPQNESTAYLQNNLDINTADSQDSSLTRGSEQHLGKKSRLYHVSSLARNSLKRLKKWIADFNLPFQLRLCVHPCLKQSFID